MPFVKTFDQRNSKKELPFVKTFDQRDNRKENDDWNFQTLYQIADIKMQRFHASENLMTQFTFSLLRLP